MAETTLHPSKSPQAQAILAEAPLTQYQALRKVGFILGFDFVMLTLLICVLVFFSFWFFFSRPTFAQCTFGAVLCLLIFHAWTVSLVFRCMHNVLLVRSEINLMPEEAARLVVAFHAGTAPRR